MTKDQQKRRIRYLWSKAKRYSNKVRLQARLQKMADQNLREMMIDDIQDDEDDDTHTIDNQQKIRWYLIDTERTFCKVWDFLITCITIYNLVVTPWIIVFPQIYTSCIELKKNNVIGLNIKAYNDDPTELCLSGEYGPSSAA